MSRTEIESTLNEAVELGLIWKAPWGYFVEVSDSGNAAPFGTTASSSGFVSKERLIDFFETSSDTFARLMNNISLLKNGKTPLATIYHLC